MKRIVAALWAVLVLMLMVLVVNYVSNEAMIKAYNNKKYEKNFLAALGFTQPYISHYNQGNNYFQLGYYDLAEDEYEKALDFNPPEDMDCQIRINLALAMTTPIDKDQVNPDNLEDTLEILHDAQDILCENGCASMDEDDEGHSKDAQQLKEDIDEFIKELGVTVTFTKVDEEGKTLTGAKLQVLDNAGNVIHEWESSDIPYRDNGFRIGETYVMREVEAPEGYQKAEDIQFTVKEDGTISYANQDKKKKNEVEMIDEEEQEGEGGGSGGDGGGDGNPDPNSGGGDGEPVPVEDDPMASLELLYQGLEEQGWEERNEVWQPNEYEYYSGEPW